MATLRFLPTTQQRLTDAVHTHHAPIEHHAYLHDWICLLWAVVCNQRCAETRSTEITDSAHSAPPRHTALVQDNSVFWYTRRRHLAYVCLARGDFAHHVHRDRPRLVCYLSLFPVTSRVLHKMSIRAVAPQPRIPASEPSGPQ